MIIKWKTDSFSTNIDLVECIRETNKYVFVHDYVNGHKTTKERKFNKHGYFAIYHDTFNDARESLVKRVKTEIEVFQNRLHKAESQLVSLKAMRDTITHKDNGR